MNIVDKILVDPITRGLKFFTKGGAMVTASNAEFASNSSTTNTSDTTSFAYGSAGSSVLTSTPATEIISKRVKFTTTVKDTDLLMIEIRGSTTGHWFPLYSEAAGSNLICGLQQQNGKYYGIGFHETPFSSTEIDIIFGKYRNNSSGTFGGVSPNTWPAGFFWRVRKSSI